MSQNFPQPPPAKSDRNSHEVSGDEARPAETRQHQTSGGGHRSGSRGAGTLEDAEERAQPHQGPTSYSATRSGSSRSYSERTAR